MKIQTRIKRLSLKEVLKLVRDEKEIAEGKIERLAIKPKMDDNSLSIINDSFKLNDLIKLCDKILKEGDKEDIREFLNGEWTVIYVPDVVTESRSDDYFEEPMNEKPEFDGQTDDDNIIDIRPIGLKLHKGPHIDPSVILETTGNINIGLVGSGIRNHSIPGVKSIKGENNAKR